jgi:hypothetical protein
MRYFLDTEFNGFGGELISLALVREDGESLYLVYPELKWYDFWVQENVLPVLWKDLPPQRSLLMDTHQLEYTWQGHPLIQEFLQGDPGPMIVTDWPDDIRYFCQSIITGPGSMINIPKVSFEMVRVDAYPTTLEGAVQHNSWWDAMALREKLR